MTDRRGHMVSARDSLARGGLRRSDVALAIPFALFVACAPEEIAVATIDDAGPPGSCATNDECGIESYCARASCADTRGRCERRPTSCGAAPDVSCGCDGITYFSDCLRRASGVSAATAGECGVAALRCGGPESTACPSDAYCAKLLPPMCPPVPRGVCWVLPSACAPEPPGGDRFAECGGGGPNCVDTCNAIRTERPHSRVAKCGPPK